MDRCCVLVSLDSSAVVLGSSSQHTDQNLLHRWSSCASERHRSYRKVASSVEIFVGIASRRDLGPEFAISQAQHDGPVSIKLNLPPVASHILKAVANMSINQPPALDHNHRPWLFPSAQS
jgi:hypothetical protein